MARGNWRNWEEINCSGPKCKNVAYKKYAILKNGKYYCPSCMKKINFSDQKGGGGYRVA